jgi:hypothetical protein
LFNIPHMADRLIPYVSDNCFLVCVPATNIDLISFAVSKFIFAVHVLSGCICNPCLLPRAVFSGWVLCPLVNPFACRPFDTQSNLFSSDVPRNR